MCIYSRRLRVEDNIPGFFELPPYPGLYILHPNDYDGTAIIGVSSETSTTSGFEWPSHKGASGRLRHRTVNDCANRQAMPFLLVTVCGHWRAIAESSMEQKTRRSRSALSFTIESRSVAHHYGWADRANAKFVELVRETVGSSRAESIGMLKTLWNIRCYSVQSLLLFSPYGPICRISTNPS